MDFFRETLDELRVERYGRHSSKRLSRTVSTIDRMRPEVMHIIICLGHKMIIHNFNIYVYLANYIAIVQVNRYPMLFL